MWSFASHAVAGSLVSRSNMLKPRQVIFDCSGDEASPSASKEDVLECPICWESFNIVENVPYVLWCGHSLCKNCVLKIQWAIVNFPAVPIQLPLFISCPWCHCLSLRLLYRGQLKFPRKNFSLLWMVESMNNHHSKWFNQDQFASTSTTPLLGENSNHHQRQESMPTTTTQHMHSDNSHSNWRQTSLLNNSSVGNNEFSLQKLLVFLMHLTAKFPLVVICLFVVLYVIPASAAILALYILVTLLFALPSLLILYFAYPGLDWLIREITS